jgi:response regulator RpfG family c-di-GMP phosphodiesterase
MILETSVDCELLEFSSIPECISYIEVDPPEDLLFVLSEVEINEKSGMELLEWFRNHFKGIPFIWISTPENRGKLITRQSLEQGKASGFIPKPFKDDEFFPIVDKVLLERAENIRNQSDDAEEDSLYSDKKKKQQDEVEADWDLNSKKEAKEVEADWDIQAKGEGCEQEADWDLNAKGEGSEQEADWDIQAKGDGSEQEADWDINAKGVGSEQEADWDLNVNSNTSEVEADWSLTSSKKSYIKEGYKSFKAKRLFALDKMVTDVYIALSNDKFLKIFSQKDPLEDHRLQKYIDKGVEYLYITDEEFPTFSEYFLNIVVDKLKKVKEAPVQVKSVAELAAFDNILSTVKQIGITGATAEQIKESIASGIETIDKINSLKDIFSTIYRSQNYISEHSLLTSYIAGKIATDTSWNSPQTLEKLSLAALLHDVAIEDQYLASQHDLYFDDLDKLKSEQGEEIYQMIFNHASKACEVLSKGQHIFADVENIIIQHHESPRASGYPAKLNSSVISPLSCLFIIAERYTHLLIKHNMNIEGSLETHFEDFNTGNFKTPLKSFFNVFSQV